MMLKYFTYLEIICSATDFRMLFILQIVSAGNGIAVNTVAVGDNDIITGISVHF